MKERKNLKIGHSLPKGSLRVLDIGYSDKNNGNLGVKSPAFEKMRVV
jgi:hypothetical protein